MESVTPRNTWLSRKRCRPTPQRPSRHWSLPSYIGLVSETLTAKQQSSSERAAGKKTYTTSMTGSSPFLSRSSYVFRVSPSLQPKRPTMARLRPSWSSHMGRRRARRHLARSNWACALCFPMMRESFLWNTGMYCVVVVVVCCSTAVDPVERKSKVVIRYSKFVARLSVVTVSPQSVPAQRCRCVTQSKTVMASHSTSRLSHCVSWNIPSWASKENLSHTEFHVWGEARPFYSRAPAGSSTPSPTSPMSRLWSRPLERL